MRKVKVINVEERGEVTLKEVTPFSVYQAWNEDDRLKAFEALLEGAVSPPVSEIKTWYSSEIETVLSAFLEVNNSFFGIARQLRMDGLLTEFIKTLTGSLPGAFADSFKQAMSTPGITDGRSL